MKEYKTEINGKEMMIDSQGRYVPSEAIKPGELLRDELIRALMPEVEELSKRIAELKAKAFRDVDSFLDLSASQYGVRSKAIKGNISLKTFNGEYEIRLASADNIEFDEQLQVAKELIDECLTEWCDGANAKLAVIVKDAFKVDRKGRLDKSRILGLRKYEIEDEKWKKAMEAISNSVSVTGRRRYIRFFRIDDSGRETQLMLNWTDF